MQTPIDLISEEQYLVQEPQAEYKSEFRDGRTVAMSGANFVHNQIAAKLLSQLALQLKTSPCDVVGSDMRVKVAAAHFYTYPDISVVCGQPAFDAVDRNALLNPVVIIEVLSASTEVYDRGEKFEYYKKLPSLREYVLVSQTSPCVESFVREGSGVWTGKHQAKLTDFLELRAIDCRIALSEIFHKVTFEP